MKKSIAVLGLGRFGQSLAENLYRQGADVLAVDNDEDVVQSFSDKCTSAVFADLTNEAEVTELGLKDMDIVIVCMSHSLAPSVMSITVAKEQGVPLVVAKTSSERMSSILRKVGADRIIDPDGESGTRVARVLLAETFMDVYELDDNMYMVEMNPKEEWLGKSLEELKLRSKLNLNVVAERGGRGLWHFIPPQKPLTKQMLLLIVVEKKNITLLQ